jgi:hypothetical protein
VERDKVDADNERNLDQLHEDKEQVQDGLLLGETLSAHDPDRPRLFEAFPHPEYGPENSNRNQGVK